MKTYFKRHWEKMLTAVLVIPILVLWIVHQVSAGTPFAAGNLLTYVSQISALIGTALFAIVLLILPSTNKASFRFRSGLETTAFLLLITHPVVATITLISMGGIGSELQNNLWALQFGAYAFILLSCLQIVRFLSQKEKASLRNIPFILSTILFLGTVHAFFIPSSLSENVMIRAYMLTLITSSISLHMYLLLLRFARKTTVSVRKEFSKTQ